MLLLGCFGLLLAGNALQPTARSVDPSFHRLNSCIQSGESVDITPTLTLPASLELSLSAGRAEHPSNDIGRVDETVLQQFVKHDEMELRVAAPERGEDREELDASCGRGREGAKEGEVPGFPESQPLRHVRLTKCETHLSSTFRKCENDLEPTCKMV